MKPLPHSQTPPNAIHFNIGEKISNRELEYIVKLYI
jgi:hypothetical protein